MGLLRRTLRFLVSIVEQPPMALHQETYKCIKHAKLLWIFLSSSGPKYTRPLALPPTRVLNITQLRRK